jgi:hypothetical protein
MDQEKTNKEKAEKFMNMGLGKLASPEIIFPRAFRWTFHPAGHDETRWWFTKLKVDYKNKFIEINAYDDVKGEVHAWLNAMTTDASCREAQLRHYDGCGRTIYVIDFMGLEVQEHTVTYDYGSSEVITHVLKISFRRAKRTNDLHIN